MNREAESMCRKLADDAFSLARIREAMEWAYRDAAAVCSGVDSSEPGDYGLGYVHGAMECAEAIEARLK